MPLKTSLILLAATGVAAAGVAESRSGNEIEIITPPPTPAVFAPEIVSTGFDEYGLTVTADWRELYFTRIEGETSTIMTSRRIDGRWEQPETAPFSGGGNDSHPYLLVGSDQLIFTSRRPCPGARNTVNVWMVQRRGDGWGSPRSPGPPLTDQLVHAATMAPDGSMWATGLVQFPAGEHGFEAPRAPQPPVKGSHPAVTVDGSWLVFSARATGSVGSNDLYAVHLAHGQLQGRPVSLSGGVNTPAVESSPTFSGDGAALFFSRNGDIYWVATAAVLPDITEGTNQ